MSRLIALLVVFGGVYWLWQRWQKSSGIEQDNSHSNNTERLTQCPRCDAMLPQSQDQQSEVARSCEHGERCPLKSQQ